ncbi:MAG TPA: hypothetical protein VFT12_04405 [Thermoanaerobaculia bacterium]|nr:hypothetical protein [Thermoanaerobaculia bacterium]
MRLTAATLLLLTAMAPAASADLFDCKNTAPHRLAADVNGATAIVIVGKAGSLRVTGAGQRNVTASGTACASDSDFLQKMRIEARREGSELRIEAVIPERTVLFGFHNARLDMEVAVPDDLPIRIQDGSGSTEVRGVAALEIHDGSGEIDIRDVRGDVEVSDGSGAISIERVGGGVRIAADGSGGIEIRDVERNVVVDTDGSGSIDVSDVRGDFIVDKDGSGGIDYDRIGGSVSIPSRKR